MLTEKLTLNHDNLANRGKQTVLKDAVTCSLLSTDNSNNNFRSGDILF